jgi:hypothetical protein
VTMLVCFFHFAHKAAGASRARLSLRPLISGRDVLANLGHIVSRECGTVSLNVIARSESDEAIHTYCFAARWIASRSLSSGGAKAPTRWLAMTVQPSSPGLTGRSSIPEALMIEPTGRSVWVPAFAGTIMFTPPAIRYSPDFRGWREIPAPRRRVRGSGSAS